MKSYEEMAQNVFKRGDEYFRKKKKRSEIIKKGTSFLVLSGIFSLVSFSMLNSDNVNQSDPEEKVKLIL